MDFPVDVIESTASFTHDLMTFEEDEDTTVPLPVAVPVGVVKSGAPAYLLEPFRGKQANEGQDGSKFTITGLTMPIKNPKYKHILERRKYLTDRYRVDTITRARSRKWLTEEELIPSHGLYPDPTLAAPFDRDAAEIRQVLNDGTWVRKPADIAGERNALYQGTFAKIIDEFVASDAALLAFYESIGVSNVAAAAKPIVLSNAAAFKTSLKANQLSDLPVTLDELQSIYTEYLKTEVMLRKQKGALPFSGGMDYVAEARQKYIAQTIESLPVSLMNSRNGDVDDNVDNIDNWLDAWFVMHGELLKPGDVPYLRQLAAKLVTDTPDPRSPIRPDVALRDTTILSMAQLQARFLESFKKAVGLELAIQNIGDAAKQYPGEPIADLRRQKRNQGPFAQTALVSMYARRVRSFFEADGIRQNMEARMRQVEYELSKVPAFVPAPMSVVRDTNSPKSFILTVQVEKTDEGKREEGLRVDDPQVEYVYKWYFHPGAVAGDQVLLASETTGNSTSTLSIVGENNTTSSNAYGAGTHAGTYWCEVSRIFDQFSTTTLYSDVARLRIFSTCSRCPNVFEVGYGIARRFGECEWKAKPVNRSTAEFQARASFRPYKLKLRGTGPMDIQPRLDDSVIDAAGFVIGDDAGLLSMAGISHDALVERFFDYDAIMRNIAERFTKKLTERYTAEGARAAILLYTQRLPAQLKASKDAAFIGAIYSAIDAPGEQLVLEVEDLIAPVGVRLAAAEVNAARIQARLQSLVELAPDIAEQEAAVLMLRDAETDALGIQRLRHEVFAQLETGEPFTSFNFFTQDNPKILLQAADALSLAGSLREVPVMAILEAFRVSHALRTAATVSEMRFLRVIEGRMVTFTRFFRSVAQDFEANSLENQLLAERRGESLLRMTIDVGFESYRNVKRRKVQTTTYSLRTIAQEQADLRLARMTADDIRSSQTWFYASHHTMLTKNSVELFVDEVGVHRLLTRISNASKRYDIHLDTQKRIARSLSTGQTRATNELEIAHALGRPLGVPLSIWLELESVATSSGIAAAASVAREIAHAGGLEGAFGLYDWRGVHSETDDQVQPYEVYFHGNNNAEVVRGSERLYSGYDFRGLHQKISKLVYEYNNSNDAARRAQIQGQIETLTVHFNGLTQFAPKLPAGAALTADDIQAELNRALNLGQRVIVA